MSSLTYNRTNGAKSTFFFFPAEDGIRDRTVTGVQTCALPIFGLLGSEHAGGDSAERQRRRKAPRLLVALEFELERALLPARVAEAEDRGQQRCPELSRLGLRCRRLLAREQQAPASQLGLEVPGDRVAHRLF